MCSAAAGEGVAHGIGVGRGDTGQLGGEDEVIRLDLEVADDPHLLGVAPEIGQGGRGHLIEGDPAKAGSDFRALTSTPPLVVTTLSSMTTVAWSRSTLAHRMAQASPRRIPVAATTKTKACSRGPELSAEARRERTSSVFGARMGSAPSWRAQSGSSVSATGLGRPASVSAGDTRAQILPAVELPSRHRIVDGGGRAERTSRIARDDCWAAGLEGDHLGQGPLCRPLSTSK